MYIEAVINGTSKKNNNDELTFFTQFNEFGYGIGAIFACFSTHTVIPNLKGNMRNPDEFGGVIKVVWIVITTAMISIGAAGYIAYGNDCDEAVSSNFTGYFSYIASAVLLIKVWSVPALCLYPVTLIVESLVEKCTNKNTNNNNNDNDSQKENNENMISKLGEKCKKYTIRIVLVFVALVISLVLPSFSFMANILGSVCALAMAVIFPCLMYVIWKRQQKKIGKSEALKKSTNFKMICAIVVLVILSIIGLWNVYFLLYYGTDVP